MKKLDPIVIFSTRIDFGGGQKALSYILKFLINKNNHIQFFCRSELYNNSSFYFLGLKPISILYDKTCKSKFLYFIQKFLKFLWYASFKRIYFFKFISEIFYYYRVLLLTEEDRLIHVDDATNKQAILGAYFAGFKKILGTYRTIPSNQFIPKSRQKSLMYKWANSKLDFVTTPSQKAKKLWSETEKISLNKIKVIYNGVNIPSKFSFPEKENNIVKILINGKLVARKGHFNLFDAIAGSNYLKRFAFIDVVGNGPAETVFKKKIHELGIDSNVRFWGFQRDVEPFYLNAHIFCLPSFRENFPWVLLEAMSYKVPVISTNLGGIPEIIDNGVNGYLFKAGDTKTLNVHLEDLAQNSEKRIKMGERGFQKVRDNFTFEKMVEETYQVYEKLLNE